MTTKKTKADSGKEQVCCRTVFPDKIQYDLDAVGGVKGLCKRLPTQKRIAKMSATYHALSDPVRMTILHLLAVQPLCVCVIKECIGIADSKLSYHLTIMKKADLIEGEQQGNWIIYHLTDLGKKYADETA
jgi:DNA-binding transcriptional ArsR family regulator